MVRSELGSRPCLSTAHHTRRCFFLSKSELRAAGTSHSFVGKESHHRGGDGHCSPNTYSISAKTKNSKGKTNSRQEGYGTPALGWFTVTLEATENYQEQDRHALWWSKQSPQPRVGSAYFLTGPWVNLSPGSWEMRRKVRQRHCSKLQRHNSELVDPKLSQIGAQVTSLRPATTSGPKGQPGTPGLVHQMPVARLLKCSKSGLLHTVGKTTEICVASDPGPGSSWKSPVLSFPEFPVSRTCPTNPIEGSFSTPDRPQKISSLYPNVPLIPGTPGVGVGGSTTCQTQECRIRVLWVLNDPRAKLEL